MKKLEKILKKLELFLGKGPWKIKLDRTLVGILLKIVPCPEDDIDKRKGVLLLVMKFYKVEKRSLRAG